MEADPRHIGRATLLWVSTIVMNMVDAVVAEDPAGLTGAIPIRAKAAGLHPTSTNDSSLRHHERRA